MGSEASSIADVVREFTNNNKQKRQQESVFLPYDYQTNELDVGHSAYSVRLMDTPFNQNSTTTTAKSEEEAIHATNHEPHEAKMGDYTVSLIHYIATGQKVASDGSIVLAPLPKHNNNNKNNKQKSVMISNGEVLLSDLRSEIIAQGMKAEYTVHYYNNN